MLRAAIIQLSARRRTLSWNWDRRRVALPRLSIRVVCLVSCAIAWSWLCSCNCCAAALEFGGGIVGPHNRGRMGVVVQRGGIPCGPGRAGGRGGHSALAPPLLPHDLRPPLSAAFSRLLRAADSVEQADTVACSCSDRGCIPLPGAASRVSHFVAGLRPENTI